MILKNYYFKKILVIVVLEKKCNFSFYLSFEIYFRVFQKSFSLPENLEDVEGCDDLHEEQDENRSQFHLDQILAVEPEPGGNLRNFKNSF